MCPYCQDVPVNHFCDNCGEHLAEIPRNGCGIVQMITDGSKTAKRCLLSKDHVGDHQWSDVRPLKHILEPIYIEMAAEIAANRRRILAEFTNNPN